VFATNSCQKILEYLQHQLPEYPFDPDLDQAFVQEMAQDFSDIDILEEIKAFRWYYDNDPVQKVSSVRIAIRRWVGKAYSRAYS
jgi:hypothetical protein